MEQYDGNTLILQLSKLIVRRDTDGRRQQRHAGHPFIHQLQNNVALAADLIARGTHEHLIMEIAGSGGEASAEWLVLGAEGETVKVTARAPRLGLREIEVKLAATGGAR